MSQRGLLRCTDPDPDSRSLNRTYIPFDSMMMRPQLAEGSLSSNLTENHIGISCYTRPLAKRPRSRKLPALSVLAYLFSPSRSLQQLFVLRLSRFLLFTCWRQSVRFGFGIGVGDGIGEFVPFRSTATPLRRTHSISYVYISHLSLLCSLCGWGVFEGGVG